MHQSVDISEVRYETAIELILQDYAISDIARLLGYTEPTHFTRAFRRIAGVSPSEYRIYR